MPLLTLVERLNLKYIKGEKKMELKNANRSWSYNEDCSELGTIAVKSFGGGIARVG